jgi:CubicO group peptidase (beta-lactamase class C family)
MAMPKLPLLLLVLAFTLPTRAAAQWPAAAVGPSSPTQPAFDADRLRRIDTFFQRHVDESRIGGAVVLVLQDGRPVYERAFGWSDKEAGRRMSADSIFRIASQSKALTSVGILSLMEEGKLGLTDPVSLFIPAFARTTVTTESNGEVSTVPAKRAVTIRDLLTHTAGISYGTGRSEAALYEAKGLGPAAGFGWYTADKDEPICETMERLASLPLPRNPANRTSMVTTRTCSAA